MLAPSEPDVSLTAACMCLCVDLRGGQWFNQGGPINMNTFVYVRLYTWLCVNMRLLVLSLLPAIHVHRLSR